MGKTIFVGASKGGVGKTMTTASLGVGLARQGKRALIIDTDSQHSLTVSLGIREPDRLPRHAHKHNDGHYQRARL